MTNTVGNMAVWLALEHASKYTLPSYTDPHKHKNEQEVVYIFACDVCVEGRGQVSVSLTCSSLCFKHRQGTLLNLELTDLAGFTSREVQGPPCLYLSTLELEMYAIESGFYLNGSSLCLHGKHFTNCVIAQPT